MRRDPLSEGVESHRFFFGEVPRFAPQCPHVYAGVYPQQESNLKIEQT
jgi:hypothetical protein